MSSNWAIKRFLFAICSIIEDLPLEERFSKSHFEREKILQQRKDTMLTLARKRYIFFNHIIIMNSMKLSYEIMSLLFFVRTRYLEKSKRQSGVRGMDEN